MCLQHFKWTSPLFSKIYFSKNGMCLVFSWIKETSWSLRILGAFLIGLIMSFGGNFKKWKKIWECNSNEREIWWIPQLIAHEVIYGCWCEYEFQKMSSKVRGNWWNLWINSLASSLLFLEVSKSLLLIFYASK